MCRPRGHVRFHDEESVDRRRRPQCSRHAIILSLCILVVFFKSPGQNNVMGSSVPFILADLRMETMEFARCFSLGTGIAALLQPFFGRALDVHGVRRCMPVGCVLLALGLALLGAARGPMAIFAAFVLIRATAIGCLDSWPSATVALWFVRYRGRAMALLKLMGGIPTGVVASLMQVFDGLLGWRLTIGVIIPSSLMLVAACCAAGLRNQPASETPCTELAEVSATSPAKLVSEDSPVGREAGQCPQAPTAVAAEQRTELRGLRFWYTLGVLYLSMCSMTAIGGGIDLFTVEIARGGEGNQVYDVAAFVFLPMGVSVSTFCLICGFVIDYGVPLQYLIAITNCMHAAAAISATAMATPQGGLVYAIIRGVASGLASPLAGCFIPRFFGTKRLGLLLGGQSLMAVGGTCLGSLLVGGAPAAFGGSYNPMLRMMALFPLALAALALPLRQPQDQGKGSPPDRDTPAAVPSSAPSAKQAAPLSGPAEPGTK